MKIRLLSDLHLEHAPFDYRDEGEDVLVLAGDIHNLFDECSQFIEKVPKHILILMVAGNHEFYGNFYFEALRDLKLIQNKSSNFIFLENQPYSYQGVEFFGGTMFSDFKLNGVAEEFAARKAAETWINDFRAIRTPDFGEGGRWNTANHLAENSSFVRAFRDWLEGKEDSKKKVVISHFVPTPLAIPEQYAGDILNAYFVSDMTKYLGFDGLWLFGHTHDSFDLKLGETRLVCNPKGYHNQNKNFNGKLILEI